MMCLQRHQMRSVLPTDAEDIPPGKGTIHKSLMALLPGASAEADLSYFFLLPHCLVYLVLTGAWATPVWLAQCLKHKNTFT